jgi:tRNA(Ile)-lysidine synthetase-like protein
MPSKSGTTTPNITTVLSSSLRRWVSIAQLSQRAGSGGSFYNLTMPYPADLNRPLAQLAAATLWEHVGGGALVVACSGGPDSVALARAARELLDDPQFNARFAKQPRLVLWHLDHGIREGSAGDAEFVQTLAEELRAEAMIERVELGARIATDGGNLEAEARTERYTRLLKLLDDNAGWRAVTGHHLDDQAETVLHHLVRGTHLAGLRGIAPVYRGVVYRPWLELRRGELVAYLDSRGQRYVTDETNADTAFTRNKLRHEVLPLLEQINPGAIEHIARLSTLAREAVDARQERLSELEVSVFNADELARWLPLLGWPRGYEVHRLWEGWDECGQLAAYTSHVVKARFGTLSAAEHDQIVDWAAEPDIPLAMRGLSVAVPHAQLLTLTESLVKSDPPVSWQLRGPVTQGSLLCELFEKPHSAWELHKRRDRHAWENLRRWPDALAELCSSATPTLDGDLRPNWECYLGDVALPLTLRTWRAGERMQLAGGGSATIGDLFTNAKVPEPLRPLWCVLADAHNNALWLPGIADGAAMRIEGEPKLMVKLRIT